MKLDRLVRALYCTDPATWAGPLHVHVVGKGGEAFFSTGFLPAIRKCVPAARVIYHVHEEYESLISACQHRPDEVEMQRRRPELSLAEDVNMRIYELQEELDGVGWKQRGDGLVLSMYYENLERPTDAPFYRQNMASLGVGHLKYTPPRLANPGPKREPIALVLPTGNWQSAIRMLPVPAAEWKRLAGLCVERGWHPVARGYQADGVPKMPGWDFRPDTAQINTLRLGPSIVRAVGLNMGMLFALTQVCPGHVTMLDPHHGQKYYDFRPMVSDGVIDLGRHHQVPVPLELTPQQATRLVEDALFAV